MRSLVTGGAGFLGSHLCDELINRGDEVICLDNLITGLKENICHLLNNERFIFVKGDVTIKINVKVDRIFHLASPAAPADCRENKNEVLKANVEGTLNLLKLNVPLLYTSSVRVLDSLGDKNYADSKHAGEILCDIYGAKVARLGSVYGPRMAYNDSRIIPTFIRQSPNISIYGDGSSLDSFCYVSDIVTGLCSFMGSDFVGILEFGSPELVTILDLALLIDKEIKIDFKTGNSVNRKFPDITKAKTILGWEPKISLKEGLTKMRCL